MSRIAITRAVSRALERCELTHMERREIDLDLAREQHAAYAQALRDAKCESFPSCLIFLIRCLSKTPSSCSTKSLC